MTNFKPAFPYSTPIELLIPTYGYVKGVATTTYPTEGNGIRLNCSFKTYGGTETTTNDVFTIVHTAQVETWYRPDITADCQIRLLESGDVYKVISKPEDIDMRHQFVKFKVEAFDGGS